MYKKIMLTVLGVLSANLPADAMSATEGKSTGLIREDCKGYVTPAKPEGQKLADEINAKRQAEYERLAAEQNLPVEVVASAAGSKLCGR